MRLDVAIEILSQMHQSAAGDPGTALGIAVAALRENLERIHDEAEEVAPMIDRVLPDRESPDRQRVWRHLRPMLRLSTAVFDEVERRLKLTGVSSTAE